MKAQHQKAKLEQMLKTPFYVVSDTDNTLVWNSANGVKLNWSLNEDLTDYHELQADTKTEVQMPAGKKVYLFCTEDQNAFVNFDQSSPELDSWQCSFTTTANTFSIGGNICFLSESSCYKRTNFSPRCRNSLQFYDVFCTNSLVDAQQCVLGFSDLTSNACYMSMFSGCQELRFPPVFVSSILASVAFRDMFKNCSKIIDIHYPTMFETDETFNSMEGSPKFGAENATVHYDL